MRDNHPTARDSRRQFLVAAGAALLAAPLLARAQEFKPKKAVTLISAYPAGALGDVTARTVAKGLSELWGVPVVVENKTGAAGMIAAAEVAKAPGDGTLLLCMIPEALTVAKALGQPMPFDPEQALRPVAIPVTSACILATHGKSPFQTYADLKAYALAKPGRLNFGVQGAGSAFHLAAERWAHAEGLKINAVPYRGGAPAMTDLLAGQIDAMFLATSLGLPSIKEGRLRALAASSRQRIAELPDLKTLNEMGVADYDLGVSIGVQASAATPDALLEALNRDIRKVMQSAPARAWMAQNAVVTSELDAGTLRKRMADEVISFADIARRANIKLAP